MSVNPGKRLSENAMRRKSNLSLFTQRMRSWGVKLRYFSVSRRRLYGMVMGAGTVACRELGPSRYTTRWTACGLLCFAPCISGSSSQVTNCLQNVTQEHVGRPCTQNARGIDSPPSTGCSSTALCWEALVEIGLCQSYRD